MKSEKIEFLKNLVQLLANDKERAAEILIANEQRIKEFLRSLLMAAGAQELVPLLEKESCSWGDYKNILVALTAGLIHEKAADIKDNGQNARAADLPAQVEKDLEQVGERLKLSEADLLTGEIFAAVISLLFKLEARENERRYHETIGSHLYQNLRRAYATKDFLIPEGDRWPTADLTSRKKTLRAVAQLRPDPREIEPYLSPEELAAWQEHMAKQVLAMDDLTADVLDIISATWLRQAEHPEAMVTITADDFLRFRGLKPQKSGTGRRGGYKEEWRKEIARHIAILANTWIRVFEMDTIEEDEKGRRKKVRWRGESRAVVVTSRMGQVKWDEAGREILDVHAWRVRPGDVFAKFLFGPGRQTALLSAKALQYDPYRQRWEKRLARYFAWLWRVRQGNGGYIEPVSVAKLLEAVGASEKVGGKNPIQTKERLEKALDTLQSDKVIAAWQYEQANENIIGRRGWVKEWVRWKVIVEPPQELMEYYAKLPVNNAALPAAQDLGGRLRAARQERGLTLLQAAEEIGISPSRLCEIERGKKTKASEDTRRKIIRWLEKGL